MTLPRFAGVDGCRTGWVAMLRHEDGSVEACVVASFAELLSRLSPDALVAVDMPIGLPERVGHGGRGPEALVRRHLGPRQSSVFSIPSRAAVHAEPGPFANAEEWYAAHRRACKVARGTSDPPRGVSIQAFGIFSKIREIDALLRAEPTLCERVIESHPELAFCRLDGGSHMALPKKLRGTVHGPGMAERRALLCRHGLPAHVLSAALKGAGEDDLLDAAAMLLVAERYGRGEALPLPDPPGRDAHGLPIAIWS